MLSISATGVRDGETLVAIRLKQNAGSQIVMHKRGAQPGDLIYPPLLPSLQLYEQMGGNYEDMKSIAFFADMAPEKIKNYLNENAVTAEVYLSDLDLLVRPVALSGSVFAKIAPERLSEFLQSPPFPLSDLYNAIPRKPGSRAPRHTLAFRPTIWAVAQAEQSGASHPDADITYDIDALHLYRGSIRFESKAVFSVKLLQDSAKDAHYKVLRVVYDAKAPPLAEDDLSIIKEVLKSQETREPALSVQLDAVRKALGHLTPAYLKSAMQKALRTGAKKVQLWEAIVDGDVFLVMSFLLLFRHPGSFVPDIQTFVRGAESALKRLAVSINEDAFTEDYEALAGLYVAALVVQRQEKWRPSHAAIIHWLKLALTAHADRRCFSYTLTSRDVDWEAHDEYGAGGDKGVGSPQHVAFVLLDELRSFEWDINMLAQTDGSARDISPIPLFDTMPLEQIIDHHTTPDIFYMMPDPHENDYNALQKRIFRYVTGLNPRRADRGYSAAYYTHYEDEEFTKQLREAQRFILECKDRSWPTEKRLLLGDTYSSDYTLGDSWLAGMVGVSEVKHGARIYYASINISDIFSYDVVAKPQRSGGSKVPTVDGPVKKAVTSKYIALLEKGIVLRAAPRSMPWFSRAKVTLDNQQYIY